MLEDEAAPQHFSFHTMDLVEAIKRGDYPVWNFEIQTIDPDHLPEDFDPLDPTKEWPTERFPFKKVGEFTLNENVEAFFAENENIAFNPARLPPGIVPSADKLLQARLFACKESSQLLLLLLFWYAWLLNVRTPKHRHGQSGSPPWSQLPHAAHKRPKVSLS